MKHDEKGNLLREELIASGETIDDWVCGGQTVVVTEEYHPDGYPAPAQD